MYKVEASQEERPDVGCGHCSEWGHIEPKCPRTPLAAAGVRRDTRRGTTSVLWRGGGLPPPSGGSRVRPCGQKTYRPPPMGRRRVSWRGITEKPTLVSLVSRPLGKCASQPPNNELTTCSPVTGASGHSRLKCGDCSEEAIGLKRGKWPKCLYHAGLSNQSFELF